MIPWVVLFQQQQSAAHKTSNSSPWLQQPNIIAVKPEYIQISNAPLLLYI